MSNFLMRLCARIAIFSVVFLTACTTTLLSPTVPKVSGTQAVGATNQPVAPIDSSQQDQEALAQTPVIKQVKPLKVALALGGGAARGFAHIGVIKVLEANGIIPDIVVGTSAGSVVGAIYAAGNDAHALQRIAAKMDEAEISDWSVPLFAKSSGVLKGEAVQHFVNRAVHQQPIEKFKIPFGAVATDLKTGKAILFRRGNAGMAARASSSVPGVFQPVPIGGREYVDGGLVAPVPVYFAREMGADIVIAVNISAVPEAQQPNTSIEVLLQTFAIMGQTINSYELKEADIVIEPSLSKMKSSDFAGRNIAIAAGERATLKMLPKIMQIIGRQAH